MKPRKSSLSEKPIRRHSRRLVDWLKLTGAKKVHSLVDKVYKKKNLELAWEKVRQNRGAGGIDGESIEAFEREAVGKLERLLMNSNTILTSPNLYVRNRYPSQGSRGSIGCWGYQRSMIEYANRHY